MSPENLDLFLPLPPISLLYPTMLPNGATVAMDVDMNGTERSTSLGSAPSESKN